MKRIAAFCLALLLCALFGCQTAVEDDGVFHLKTLPDIGEYTPAVKAERWYDTYVDTFIPSAEYGKLIPFLGRRLHFVGTTNYGEEHTYEWDVDFLGLCTTDGKIVLEPVYDNIVEQNGCYILLDTVSNTHPLLVIPTDGSSIRYQSTAEYASAQVLSNGRVLAMVPQYKHVYDGEPYSVYDTDGTLLYTFPRNCYVSEKGRYLVENNYDTDEINLYDRDLRLMDFHGDIQPVGNYYTFYEPPYDFYGSGLYGILDADLNAVLPAAYRKCVCLDGHYLCIGDAVEVYDEDFNYLRDADVTPVYSWDWGVIDEYGNVSWGGTEGKYLRWTTSSGKHGYVDADGRILDEEPTFREWVDEKPYQFSEQDDYYVTTYKGKTIVKINKEQF